MPAARGDDQHGQRRHASLATILVMALSSFAVASLRNFIPHEIRIPVFILIVAALVTVVDLLFNANLHELYLVLGIFIPLIVTNCIVLAASRPSRQRTRRCTPLSTASSWASACCGRWPCWAACVNSLAPARCSPASTSSSSLQPLQVLPADYPGPVANILPPGAFILLGCMIAWKNWVEARAARRQHRTAVPVAAGGCH